MSNPTLTKTFTAENVLMPHRIVAHGSTDGAVIEADSATATMLGVSAEIGADAGGCIDVHLAGMPLVEYGGVIPRGAPLTSNAIGQAIEATPAAGVNHRIIGFASVSGVSGDIVAFNLSLHTMQGA